MNFLKHIFYMSFLTLVLASCVGGEKHPPSSFADIASNAPFIVEQITQPENVTQFINFIEKDGLKDTFIVNLKTCLKDSFKKDNSIQGASFVIEYETNLNGQERETAKVSVTSDVNGCIRWAETYKYRYVIQGKWIVLKRTIKQEEGAYSGQEEISLAVNPWLESGDNKFPEVLDLRVNHSKDYPVFKDHPLDLNGIEYLSKNVSSKYPQLWAPEVDLQITNLLKKNASKEENSKEENSIKKLLSQYKTICSSKTDKNCYKRDFNIKLTIPLKLRTYALSKEFTDEDVEGGSYQVKLQLLVIPDINKKTYRIHEDVCDKSIQINKNGTKYINLSCDISIFYFSQNASYRLAVEIDPKENLPFTKFQGVYTIDLAEGLKSGEVTKYPFDNNIDIYYTKIPVQNVSIISDLGIQYIYDAIKPSETESETEDYSTLEKKKLTELGFHSVYLDVIPSKTTFSDVVNDKICSDNESVVKRKVRYTGKTCVLDTLKKEYKEGIEFRVLIEDESTGKIEEVFFKPKDKAPIEIPKTNGKGCVFWTYTIEHKNFDRQTYFIKKLHFLSEAHNLYGTTEVAFNPWQKAFQSHQNVAQTGVGGTRISSAGVDKPKMIINQFKSINLFPSYVLDRFLNIHLFHSLYFLFQPFITRHDNVSEGLQNKAREILRDGYYILRVLLLRNPQETGDANRVKTPDDIAKVREQDKNAEGVLKGDGSGRYITHIDTVINVDANFANVHLPLYFNKEQFFYLASRNLLSIQVIPADPSGFKFKPVIKEEDTCELDLEKTVWKPFFDHDLITKPYVGVFQVQNWTNWNILQAVEEDFDTDKFIDADSEGKKYRHFTLNPFKLEEELVAPLVLQYEEASCKEDVNSKDFDAKSCKSKDRIQKHYEARFHESILKVNKNIKKEITSEDLVKDFAATNSLTVVNLDDEVKGVNFVNDLHNSYGAIAKLKVNKKGIKLDSLKSSFSDGIRKGLKDRVFSICEVEYTPFYIWGGCEEYVKENYLIELLEELKVSKKASDIGDLSEIEKRRADIEEVFQTVIDEDLITNKISSALINNVSNTLEQVIDEGITEVNRNSLEVLTFAKSLCGFWFESFYEKYLTTEQLRTSYTNYIKKFDYYKVLENNTLNDTSKGEFLSSFLKMISNGDKELEKCHLNYGQCILVDHCKLRDHTELSTKGYCKRASNLEDVSCLKVVEKECEKNGSISVCKKEITATNCHSFLNNFCKINSNYKICQSYESRCLTNYHECIGTNGIIEGFKESITEENINVLTQTSKGLEESNSFFNLGLEKVRKTPLLKTCLENPFDFFQFEFKMFIEELSKTPPTYSGGFAGNIGVGGSFSTGSYMNWTSSRGSSLGLKHGVDVGFSLGKGSLGIKALGVSLSKNISSNISNSGRRAIDVRVAEGAFLVVSRATFDIDVTKFKKCVVIKPKPNAFFSYFTDDGVWESYDESIWNQDFRDHPYKKIFVSRPGMMICNPKRNFSEDNPEKIDESYYYISQSMVDPSNSQFLNLYDLANRPFMAILRGRQEFLKYFKGLKTIMEGKRGERGGIAKNLQTNDVPSNMFVRYPHPADEALSFSLTRREMGETGFHSGVYTYAYSQEELNQNFVTNNSWISKLFKKYEGVNYFLPLTPPPETSIPMQDY